jgi:hypothetical protein
LVCLLWLLLLVAVVGSLPLPSAFVVTLASLLLLVIGWLSVRRCRLLPVWLLSSLSLFVAVVCLSAHGCSLPLRCSLPFGCWSSGWLLAVSCHYTHVASVSPLPVCLVWLVAWLFRFAVYWFGFARLLAVIVISVIVTPLPLVVTVVITVGSVCCFVAIVWLPFRFGQLSFAVIVIAVGLLLRQFAGCFARLPSLLFSLSLWLFIVIVCRSLLVVVVVVCCCLFAVCCRRLLLPLPLKRCLLSVALNVCRQLPRFDYGCCHLLLFRCRAVALFGCCRAIVGGCWLLLLCHCFLVSRRYHGWFVRRFVSVACLVVIYCHRCLLFVCCCWLVVVCFGYAVSPGCCCCTG